MAPRTALHLTVALAVAMTADVALGFTPKANISMPPSSATSTGPTSNSADSVVSQNMLSSFGLETERGDKTQVFSNSVLASCDILPSFRTAHGILSPETVSRMAENTDFGEGNQAVSRFLSRYQETGPMSCLDMLSDADVLPHLTRAMRDIL
eukprot:CAMPEP_0113650406 /NCGR_PEP_ID=MMETSP0017_2-20120614/26822_1 /TAXON_ID=2856 /ORGANISM="Cylindrotheca closterium" /LENGTH=151 /DNA_ID=CAMNT_0000562917 /DNA_START=55 /DNA_END=510 /DNA_ORIENTATION=+ /assembly_acc=CAM_ASM_000147